MKKTCIIALCFILLLSTAACGFSKEKQQEIISMFEAFDKAKDTIVLTYFELVVHETHYDLDDITYNGQKCHIVFLEENGFYSYTYNQEDLSVEFLYTLYEGFETVSFGTETLPSQIINAFFSDNCFWFRMDDPRTNLFKQIYYSWCIDTKQAEIVDSWQISKDYEYSMDGNRSKRYSFSYTAPSYENADTEESYLDVTDNKTGITKRIDSSILDTFEEGRKIKEVSKYTRFNIQQAFEDNGDIYFLSSFMVGFDGSPCYYYVYKWNFETEQCVFYTSVYFDEYQEWVSDLYVQ